jgi:hypothetical protein
MKPTAFFSKYSFRGRRKINRRSTDPDYNYYVDRYGVKSIAAFMIILILCVIDAKITIRIVEAGGREINPIMDWALSLGATWFQIIKFTVTAICLFFLILHKNFIIFGGLIDVRTIVTVILLIYSVLILYELYIYQFLI